MKSITAPVRTEDSEELYDVVCPIHGNLLSKRTFGLASAYSFSHDRIWADEH